MWCFLPKECLSADRGQIKINKEICVELEGPGARGTQVRTWPWGSGKGAAGACALPLPRPGRLPETARLASASSSVIYPSEGSFPALHTLALGGGNSASKCLRSYLPREEPSQEPSHTHRSAENTANESSSGRRSCPVDRPPFPGAGRSVKQPGRCLLERHLLRGVIPPFPSENEV